MRKQHVREKVQNIYNRTLSFLGSSGIVSLTALVFLVGYSVLPFESFMLIPGLLVASVIWVILGERISLKIANYVMRRAE